MTEPRLKTMKWLRVGDEITNKLKIINEKLNEFNLSEYDRMLILHIITGAALKEEIKKDDLQKTAIHPEHANN